MSIPSRFESLPCACFRYQRLRFSPPAVFLCHLSWPAVCRPSECVFSPPHGRLAGAAQAQPDAFATTWYNANAIDKDEFSFLKPESDFLHGTRTKCDGRVYFTKMFHAVAFQLLVAYLRFLRQESAASRSRSLSSIGTRKLHFVYRRAYLWCYWPAPYLGTRRAARNSAPQAAWFASSGILRGWNSATHELLHPFTCELGCHAVPAQRNARGFAALLAPCHSWSNANKLHRPCRSGAHDFQPIPSQKRLRSTFHLVPWQGNRFSNVPFLCHSGRKPYSSSITTSHPCTLVQHSPRRRFRAIATLSSATNVGPFLDPATGRLVMLPQHPTHQCTAFTGDAMMVLILASVSTFMTGETRYAPSSNMAAQYPSGTSSVTTTRLAITIYPIRYPRLEIATRQGAARNQIGSGIEINPRKMRRDNTTDRADDPVTAATAQPVAHVYPITATPKRLVLDRPLGSLAFDPPGMAGRIPVPDTPGA